MPAASVPDWSDEHQAIANQRGWGLYVVFENKESSVRLLPLEVKTGVPGNAMRAVVGESRKGDALSIHALRCMTHFKLKRTKR